MVALAEATRLLLAADLERLRGLEAAIADYREHRLQGDPGGGFSSLGPKAWNRAVAAVENFYT